MGKRAELDQMLSVRLSKNDLDRLSKISDHFEDTQANTVRRIIKRVHDEITQSGSFISRITKGSRVE